MSNVLIIVNMALALMLAYQSGKYGAAIEYERDVFNNRPEKFMYFFWIFDFVLAAYFIITVFGQGIRFGAGT